VPSNTIVKLTKEEKVAARLAKDADVPMIHQKNMQWVPSALTVQIHKQTLHEVERKLSDADTPRQRNALRSEIRQIKRVIGTTAEPAHRWTSETFHGKYASVLVYISPKNRRYVLAGADTPADLIIKNRRSAGVPFSRLQLFDKSAHAKYVKEDKKAATAHQTRVKIKKAKRLARRKLKAATLPEETT
jgi:hypothetical protein